MLHVMEHGCEIWYNGSQVDKIEKIQLKYLNMMLGVKTSTVTCAVYAEMGRVPLYVRYKVHKYWLRVAILEEKNG